MKVTDYFVPLLHLPLPYDMIRYIFTYCQQDFMKTINFQHIETQAKENYYFHLGNLPYPRIINVYDFYVYAYNYDYNDDNKTSLGFLHYYMPDNSLEGHVFYRYPNRS